MSHQPQTTHCTQAALALFRRRFSVEVFFLIFAGLMLLSVAAFAYIDHAKGDGESLSALTLALIPGLKSILLPG